MSREDLLERIMEDERLADLFRATMEAAVRAGDEQKLRALGRALARGALATDDAEFDDAQLVLRTVGQMEPIDLRALVMLTEKPIPLDAQGRPDRSEPGSGPIPGLAVLAHLEQLGLARERQDMKGMISGNGSPLYFANYVITPYGRQVLAHVSDAGNNAEDR